MKALNEKEKSKKITQFALILFGLAIIPATLLVIAPTTETAIPLTEMDYLKIEQYNKFNQNLPVVVSKIAEIDTSLNDLQNKNTSQDATLLSSKINKNLEKIIGVENSDFTTQLQQYVNSCKNRIQNIKDLNSEIEFKKDTKENI